MDNWLLSHAMNSELQDVYLLYYSFLKGGGGGEVSTKWKKYMETRMFCVAMYFLAPVHHNDKRSVDEKTTEEN